MLEIRSCEECRWQCTKECQKRNFPNCFEEKKLCSNCRFFGKGCAEKECNFPQLEAWEPRIIVTLDGAEEVKEKLKEMKKYKVCLIKHPTDTSGRHFAFLSDFCLEEGQNVLVDTMHGTTWGVVSEGTKDLDEEDYEFLKKAIGEKREMRKVLGVFVPFHKCIGEERK